MSASKLMGLHNGIFAEDGSGIIDNLLKFFFLKNLLTAAMIVSEQPCWICYDNVPCICMTALYHKCGFSAPRFQQIVVMS